LGKHAPWQHTYCVSPIETEASCYRHGCDPPRVSYSQPDPRPRVHLLLFAWLIFWILAVPLFHVHFPDATDHWSVLHSSGAHTVLTPDLPGEFSPPFHSRQTHITPRSVNSPELGIALFDDKSKKWKQQQVPDAHFRFRDSLLHRTTIFTAPQQYPTLHVFISFSAPRAPPQSAHHFQICATALGNRSEKDEHLAMTASMV
jgi:hypothetical protein